MKYPTFQMMGDRAVLIDLGSGIDPQVSQMLRILLAVLDRQPLPGIIDLIPAYSSMTIVYDPLVMEPDQLIQRIRDIWPGLDSRDVPAAKTVEIPVVYGGERGPDLEWTAKYCGLSPEEVIAIHAGTSYLVYMIGFTPGYPYMGEVPAAIAVPRFETPRTFVPQGSVAIAQRQTGIYPVSSPGGWRIIGWTPVTMFTPQRRPPSLLTMGDQVRFIPVTEGEACLWPK